MEAIVSVVDGEPEVEIDLEFTCHGYEVVGVLVFIRVTRSGVGIKEMGPKGN